jgi:hypothetical protein
MINIGWILTGPILLGAMTAAGISLWIKRRRKSQAVFDSFTKMQSDLTSFDEKKNKAD